MAYEADTTGITRVQRHLISKVSAALPKDIVDDLAAARASTAPGHQKAVNALLNAIVPKSLATGFNTSVVVNDAMVSRVRRVSFCHKQRVGSEGYTFTELCGPGKLGSKEAVEQGIAAGDVWRRRIQGKDLYFMRRASDFMVNTDSHERVVTGTTALKGSQDDMGDAFATLLSCRASDFGDSSWVHFAMTTDGAAVDGNSASQEAMAHLQEAYDGMHMKARSCNKTCIQVLQKPASSSSSTRDLCMKVKTATEKMEATSLKSVDALLFKDGGVSGNEVKTQLCLAAQDLANLMKLEKELKALARIA